jgi:tetratricopeptide (TPR) repeat protein
MKLLSPLLAVVFLSLPAWGNTYVVLPFFNTTRAHNLDWIGESVSESVTEALATQGLITLSREDRTEAYRRLGLRGDVSLTRATVIKIGQALDASQVVYGDFDVQPAAASSTGSKGSLKITAHVLDLRALKQGPEFAETSAIEELASAQTRVAWQTLKYLSPKRTPLESDFRSSLPEVRVDALESYIRGLLATTPDQKQKLFAEAVKLQPEFSPACYQLGMLAYASQDYKGAADWLAKVTVSDSRYRQAMFYLGICQYQTGNYADAQTAFEVVAKAVPLNEVFNNLGAVQSRLNRAEAVNNFAKALEGDLSDPVYHFNVGYGLWRQGHFEAAAERFRAVLDRDPQDTQATVMLGKCLKKTGPSTADTADRLERIKTTYEESAYRQLKAVLQPDKP